MMCKSSVFIWVLKVLNSCETVEHLNIAMNVIHRNLVMYEDIDIYRFLCNRADEMWRTFEAESDQAAIEIELNLEG